MVARLKKKHSVYSILTCNRINDPAHLKRFGLSIDVVFNRIKASYLAPKLIF